MDSYQYLIVGSGVAGATAAETIRANDPLATIAVVNDETYALYSRVMLSKPSWFLEKIPFDQIWLKGKEWYDKNNIAFFGGKQAAQLDLAAKKITCTDGTELQYEKLLLATGIRARTWNVPGAEKQSIFYLRTLDDGKAIVNAIKAKKHAVVIGSGFISFEMADLLRLAGLEASMVILESYYWEPALDEASGKMIEKVLEQNGVKIHRKSEVKEVVGGDTVEGVILKDGMRISCDMIICGIGAHCDVEWLKTSGIKTNRGIVANEYLEASVPDVWTAGDAAEYNDIVLEETVQMGNWVNAHEQGKIAGLNMLGSFDKLRIKTPFKFVSFYTTQGMGISIAFVGDARMIVGRKVIARGSPEMNSFGRFIVDAAADELVGATLVNRTKELSAIAKLIEQNVKLGGKEKELEDPNFDLKNLLPA